MRQAAALLSIFALVLQAADSTRTQRPWEEKLRARPHHVGSPYDKDNAEWLLAKLKSWGLDAKIETFEVLFPKLG